MPWDKISPENNRRLFGQGSIEDEWKCLDRSPDRQLETISLSKSNRNEQVNGVELCAFVEAFYAATDNSRARIISYAWGKALKPWLFTATIEGKQRDFESLRAKFDALVIEWARLRERGSSTATPVNDAYGQIVAMGMEAVPFLLEEVAKKSGHWFSALRWITNAPIPSEVQPGDMRAQRAFWLKWGVQNGLFRDIAGTAR